MNIQHVNIQHVNIEHVNIQHPYIQHVVHAHRRQDQVVCYGSTGGPMLRVVVPFESARSRAALVQTEKRYFAFAEMAAAFVRSHSVLSSVYDSGATR